MWESWMEDGSACLRGANYTCICKRMVGTRADDREGRSMWRSEMDLNDHEGADY